ncbi:excinuclease ABC subunit UvrA [Fibrella sp. HMF5335]|uniref:UvrABC system protein A n=1 Tax=Fibrella rubiginis TaxID=2817060 RepID=A0A939GFT4_9BACT|nr:excinuclease ABC subunit UvrA [Fibrella rubiginis]MBO0938194.1 excinuclease ABC subunit UvrA [Fibrella rubiginis]
MTSEDIVQPQTHPNRSPLTDVQLTGYEQIDVLGAREHNLKNIDVSIPRNKLVVVTGISGSGKSSLAFDTIYAEGQRRYMESFSAYARSFLGDMERPDVDKINGLSPVISIEQKTTSKNPRSTVGTTTEIFDFLRLLYARAGEAYSYVTGRKMVRQSQDQIVDTLLEQNLGKKTTILAPVVRGRKGHYREQFVQIAKMGYTKVRVDGEVQDIVPKMQLDRYKVHDIEIVIDRLVPSAEDRFRLSQSVQTALKQGKGAIQVLDAKDKLHYFSQNLMDPESGISYDEPSPNSFSFNSPYGWCPTCQGLGVVEEITEDSVIPDKSLSVSRGAIAPLGEYRELWFFKEVEVILKKYKMNLTTPVNKYPPELLHVLMHGTEEEAAVPSKKIPGTDYYNFKFQGIINFLKQQQENGSDKIQDWLRDFLVINPCPECHGMRLKKESLFFKIAEKNIAELARMDISELAAWFVGIESRMTDRQNTIGKEILKEIRKRIGFMVNIGLDYLTLDRSLKTLSGGEAQRIRLATQIGTQLVGVLYIMDEPSIGLHQRDNVKLIESLKNLRDLGNTVLVVEHDKDMMLESDYLLDIGPGAGRHGGQVVGYGTPIEFISRGGTTADYLSGRQGIRVPNERRKGSGKFLIIKGATGNTLKNVTMKLPLGRMVSITGVSGSGKSSLVHDTLFPILNQHFYKSKREPMPYKTVEGLEHIDKVIEVDQSPIGRTPRSNPATYTGMFSEIRTLFAELAEAKIRGYKPGRFSFNVKGGRCEDCEGAGMKKIEMEFLPDVHVPCETCKGKRFNRETLEVRFKGKSIADVLDMTVEQALDFFASQPRILRKVQTLSDVGLGYITLGQHATTLSGGEAQRVKLAEELSKKDTGKTLYILDEPTTGLHFQDIALLLGVLNKLVDKGNTVLVIEHNLDVIKVSDYVIDLGPEGGNKGGFIIAEGTPEKVAKAKGSHTGKFLAMELAAE